MPDCTKVIELRIIAMKIEKKASSFIKRQFRRHRRPRTSRFAKSCCKTVVFETLVFDRMI